MMGVSSPEEVVLDLFAGIGYYTLPILKSYPDTSVIACEWEQYLDRSL